MSKPTYISSLLTPDDREAVGLYLDDNYNPTFQGNIVVKDSITFPDGSKQTSAGIGVAVLPDVIDAGTF